MRRVTVTVEIAAPIERVWRALTVPDEVQKWDGVDPVAVGADYPTAGQHARWRTRLGPLSIVLHDRIRVVDRPVRFASTIDVGFVHVEEEYRLNGRADGGTTVVSDNRVSGRVPGSGGVAARLTRTNVEASMARLRTHCEA